VAQVSIVDKLQSLLGTFTFTRTFPCEKDPFIACHFRIQNDVYRDFHAECKKFQWGWCRIRGIGKVALFFRRDISLLLITNYTIIFLDAWDWFPRQKTVNPQAEVMDLGSEFVLVVSPFCRNQPSVSCRLIIIIILVRQSPDHDINFCFLKQTATFSWIPLATCKKF